MNKDRGANTLYRLPAIAAIAAAMSLGGCVARNAQTGLMGDETLSALGQSWPTDVPPSSLSISSLDRGHWQPIIVRVPLGQVEHWPTYVTTVNAGSGPRASGSFPSGASAVDEQATGPLADVGSEAMSIVMAAGDLVIAPVRAVLAPPWSTARSSSANYALLSQPGAYDTTHWIIAPETAAPQSSAP